MKTTKNPWLEERGALYKLFYYLGPCLLIIAFLLLWQGIASGGKTTEQDLPRHFQALV